MAVTSIANNRANIDHYEERVDMACASRWAVKYNLHEAAPIISALRSMKMARNF